MSNTGCQIPNTTYTQKLMKLGWRTVELLYSGNKFQAFRLGLEGKAIKEEKCNIFKVRHLMEEPLC